MGIKGNLLGIAFLLGLGGFDYSIIYLSDRADLIKKAEKYATLTVGDKKSPLNQIERKTWYEIMGVREGENPSGKDLSKFVNVVELFKKEKDEMPYWVSR
jgi:hypothetical protein